MMETNTILLLIALIVFIGYLAEWGFRKVNIPDTLLLLLVGFILGPNVTNIVKPESLNGIAPIFTTITLLFLMFDGSLSIDLKSFTEGIGAGITIGVTNFIISSIIIAGIMHIIVPDFMTALMLGFALGGVSSAFIIPILKQVQVSKKIYSILTLESALTDVLAIVFSITVIELKVINVLDLKNVLSHIASLFFVAGMIGIIAGFLWIYLELSLGLGDQNYLMTIAYVILIFFISEYLGGNGAIAAMAFGIIIANSKVLYELKNKIKPDKVSKSDGDTKIKTNVVSHREKKFYKEISFFLKTFFFVYIGLLLNLRNLEAVTIGAVISIAILLLRNISFIFTGAYKSSERVLVNSLFARGIAPAAIALVAIERGIITDNTVIDVIYFVITATVILSSIRIIFYKIRLKNEKTD